MRVIVATGGCFDLLHAGHVTFLERCRALGDALHVYINSDASVRHLKGPSRPINSLEHRKLVLESLRCVDKVLVFHENDPSQLISSEKPGIWVKGAGGYVRDSMPEWPVVESYGGRVFIDEERVDSSSAMIERIRRGIGVPCESP